MCEEPVAALDVSIQAQIIELLEELKREFGLTYLFISHDISVIGYVSDRIAVMYLGRIVEEGQTAEVLNAPAHPYTQALLASVPQVENAGKSAASVKLKGDLPSPTNPPTGCSFHTRCPIATDRCREYTPGTIDLGTGRHASCHLLPGAR